MKFGDLRLTKPGVIYYYYKKIWVFFIIAQYLMTGRALVFFPWFYFLNSSDFSGLALLSESIWLWPTSYQPPQGSCLPVKSPGIYSCPPYPGCSHLIDSLSPEYSPSHGYYSATLVETKWHLMSLLYILVMWISELTFCSLLAYNFFLFLSLTRFIVDVCSQFCQWSGSKGFRCMQNSSGGQCFTWIYATLNGDLCNGSQDFQA